MMKRYLYNLFIISFLIATNCLWAQSVSVTVRADSSSIFIGDHLRVEMIVNAARGTDIVYPVLEKSLENSGWDIVSQTQKEVYPTDEGNTHTQTAIVTAWEAGTKAFPALQFGYLQAGAEQTATSQPLTIEVKNPPLVDSAYIAGIKPILEEETTWLDYWYYWLAGLLVVLLAVGIWWLPSLLRRIKTPARLSPEELALQRLDELAKSNLLAIGNLGEYHAQISFIAREYVGARFQFRALQSTTTDLLVQIGKYNALQPFAQDLREVLETADLVKFAKASALDAGNQFAMQTVRQMVEQIQAQLKAEAAQRKA